MTRQIGLVILGFAALALGVGCSDSSSTDGKGEEAAAGSGSGSGNGGTTGSGSAGTEAATGSGSGSGNGGTTGSGSAGTEAAAGSGNGSGNGGTTGSGSAGTDAAPSLLMNGFYYACEGTAQACQSSPASQLHMLVRFYDNGTVIGASTTGIPGEKAATWFTTSNKAVQTGTYKLDGTSLSFATNSTCSYSGTVGVNSLAVYRTCANGSNGSLKFQFFSAGS